MVEKEKKGGEAVAMDPTLSAESIDVSSPGSLGRKWLQGLGADGRSSLPPEYQNSGFNDSFSLRHLKVDRVVPGLVISTFTVKPSITNRYNTLHGGALATVASIVAMAAVKTLRGGDDTFSLSEMGISYISAARINNRYNTFHGGAVATVASIVAMAAVKTLSGDKTYSLSEMCITYISAARINVELEVEAKVLRFGKSIAVSSIDIRNKTTKQITFQGRATFYHMPTSSL